MKSAEEILEQAKARKVGRLDPDYYDDKARCSMSELRTLLKAGARIHCLNGTGAGAGAYLHQVEYGKNIFISISHDFLARLSACKN